MPAISSSFLNHVHTEQTKITEKINDIQKNLSDKKILKEKLAELSVFCLRHFQFEEKEIYTRYPMEKIDDELMINRLSEEHQLIAVQIKQITSDIEKGNPPRLHPLMQTIERHHKFEKEFFYPLLDTILPMSLKNEILKKVQRL